MPNYRRHLLPGGTYFFTVNLLERYPNNLLTSNINLLREVVRYVQWKRPFHIDAWVVLPDHMHAVWTLPDNDFDFSNRWRLIKQRFSKEIPKNEQRSMTRIKRGERGIWQRRYWEHSISDQDDLNRHIDCCHINPLKHKYVHQVSDWPYSTFHKYVKKGIYPLNWAGGDVALEGSFGERGWFAAQYAQALLRPTELLSCCQWNMGFYKGLKLLTRQFIATFSSKFG